MNGEAECPADLEMTAPKNQGETPPRASPPSPHRESHENPKKPPEIIKNPRGSPFVRGSEAPRSQRGGVGSPGAGAVPAAPGMLVLGGRGVVWGGGVGGWRAEVLPSPFTSGLH